MKQWRNFSIPTAISLRSADLSTSDLSNKFQFWFILLFTIPSLICSLFLCYEYLSNRTQRTALHNHVILIVLIPNIILIFTDISWTLDSLRRSGHVSSSTASFCMIWWFLDFSLYNCQTMLLAWGSIERHILIFHQRILSTRKNRLLHYYLPPTVLLVYLFLFYIIVIFAPPCENKFDFTSVECGSNPCYLDVKSLASWDLVVNNLLPTLTIAVSSMALVYRVIAQKRRLRQPIQWRNYRRMSVQLLSLSAVYLFLNLPLTILMMIDLFLETTFQFTYLLQLYILFLTYAVTLSLPFVICLNYLFNDKNQRQRISPILTISLYR